MRRAGSNLALSFDWPPRDCLQKLFQGTEVFWNPLKATSPGVHRLRDAIGCWFGAGAMAPGLAFGVAEAGLWLLENVGSNPI